MLNFIGFWLLIMVIVLAYMTIHKHEPKKSEPKHPHVIPRPMLAPRKMYQPPRSAEQELASLQADYQRKLAILERAISDPVDRQLAQRELYARYLRQIESMI